MKLRGSDYIADFLVNNGISHVFTVVGGAAMYLNDALGHHPLLHCLYNHHEQASAIAAEAYARSQNRIACVCVTSGPGATNAITGCLCAYMGSIPMLILSGQVRYACTVRATGLNLRSNGEQEYDICRSVAGMTKYCAMIRHVSDLKYELEKALFLAKEGRPGPVWLDIPLDVQGSYVEVEEMPGFDSEKEGYCQTVSISENVIGNIVNRLVNAERPVLMCGWGVRSAGADRIFLDLAVTVNAPVVAGMPALDVIPESFPLYAGRPGTVGDRAGNFAVQNSDLFISIGSRLSYKQTGYNTETWCPQAYKVMVDVDSEELKRPWLHIDCPIVADAGEFIRLILSYIEVNRIKFPARRDWIVRCQSWRKRYPVVTDNMRKPFSDGKGNIYVLFDRISLLMPDDCIYVTSAGMSRVVCNQVLRIRGTQRLISNTTTAAMGYDLPAAIGASIANEQKPVVLVTSEGGFQMNIQRAREFPVQYREVLP